MTSIWNVFFWQDAAERALKTAAQAAASSFVVGGGLFDLDWEAALSITGAAAVLSLLTSIASIPVGEDKSASLVQAKVGEYDPDALPDPRDVTMEFDENSGTPVADDFDDGEPDHRADR